MSNFIIQATDTITAAFNSGNNGPVTWADDALATSVSILLDRIEKMQAQIDELTARLDAQPQKRGVAVGTVSSNMAMLGKFDGELIDEYLDSLNDLAATQDAASYRNQ